MDERMEVFFRRVAAALAETDQFRLWLLDAPDGPLATFLCLEWDGTVGLYNSGFRPDAAALSPGLVLLAHVIRDAIERGKRRFDFLRGEERYKYDFGPTPEDVSTVTCDDGRNGRVRGATFRAAELHIAMLSVHTCPLAALGGKETGGMNVYVRELSRELGRMGVEVDIFTRSRTRRSRASCRWPSPSAWCIWPPDRKRPCGGNASTITSTSSSTASRPGGSRTVSTMT